MSENSSRAEKRCWAVNEFVKGQLVSVSHGILAGATGVIECIPESQDQAVKVNGWPEGVYVVVVNEATKLEPA